MGTLTVTGSISINVGGRGVTTSYGPLWPSFGLLASITGNGTPFTGGALPSVSSPNTLYVPFAQPPDTGLPYYVLTGAPAPPGNYGGPLGEGSNDDRFEGLKAVVTAAGIVSSTTSGQLGYGGVQGAMPTWAVGFNPYPGKDLLTTWASRYNAVSLGEPGNFYAHPIFSVSTTDVGDITDPSFSYSALPGNKIILLTGQGGGVVHPLSTSDQNGLWVFTNGSGHTTATRPDDWAKWLANWSDETGLPNSFVFLYGYVSGSSEPFTVTNDGPAPPAGNTWQLMTSDGKTWLPVYGSVAPTTYHNGYQVLGNDGFSYKWSASYSGVLGPSPTDSAVVTPSGGWPWVSTGYQTGDAQVVDCGAIDVSYTTKMAVVLLSPLVASVSSIDLYLCAGSDNSGAHVGSFTPQSPSYLGVTLLPPTSGFQVFDYFLGGGTQEYYDGNPVRFAFNLPPHSFRLEFGGSLSSIMTLPTSASALKTAIDGMLADPRGAESVYGAGTSEVVDLGGGLFEGYILGAAGRNLGSIACRDINFQTIDQVTGFTSSFALSGTSAAWHGNIYIVPRATATQTAAQVAAAYTSGSITATATEAGSNAFQVVITSSTDPNPRIAGLTPRQPWRVVVGFADGTVGDSFSPGPICTVVARGFAYETNALVTGNLTTPPPSTGEYGFWVTVAITGNLGPSNPSVPASGASIANDIYHRPVIAIDTGSGTAIAITHDAGLTWQTHAAPSGSLPSLCIDQRSNTFILTVNSGTVATTYRNPNSDWASTTGMTTGATVSGAAAATVSEPNNGRHLLMAIVVSGALDIYESFDASSSWALRSTVTTGMATNRGLCASIQWVGSALFVIYSKGMSLFSQRSVDGGSTWQAAVTIATGHTYSFVTAVVQGGQIIVRGVDDSGSATPWHQWQSSDLAATWTDVTNASTPQTNVAKPSAIGKWEQSGKLIISGSNLT